MSVLLDIKNLSTHFRTRLGVIKAVNDVSLSLSEGETLGLVGESGCGKSVTALSIMRLVPSPPGRIVGGEVMFQGQNLVTISETEMRNIRGRDIGMIFQEPMTSLNPVLSIGRQLREPLELHLGMTKKQALDRSIELLELVGIPDPETRLKSFPHQISGGQRQRIGIARALAVNPSFIVCDEPVSALDVSIQAQVVNLLEDLQEKFGLTYLFIAHDLSVVKHISDRIAVMYLGHIVEIAPANELYSNPIHAYTRALLSAIPIPDPTIEKTRERIILEGDVPSPLNPPAGCVFKPRCTKKDKCKCAETTPILTEVEPEHWVANCVCCMAK